MSATQSTGPYRVGERISTSVWKAQDTRNGKTVALKILTKQLPKEQARRDALVRDVRVAAALYHSFVIPIVEIVPVGDNLVLVMQDLEVLPISKYLNKKPLARNDFFRLAYQLVDGAKYLHTKGLTHGNINGDSVMISPEGQIRIGGLNLGNLLTKGDGISAAYQQKGNDPRSVAYMAPEQITGQPCDPRTDMYSLGIVMYEMSTGRLPYEATAAADLARKIVEGQPLSPTAVNPSIDKAILGILGECLFKDQFRRPKEAKLLLEQISKADPDAVKYVNDLVSRSSGSSTLTSRPEAKQSILFVGQVANYEDLAIEDPQKATQSAARMQQILGEAVYLFDGSVLDPFGPQMIAEMPSTEKALEAARKGEFDFSPEQQEGEPIQVRLLLHAGPVSAKDGKVSGDGALRAMQVLAELPPQSLHITEDFLKRGRPGVRLRDARARSGVKLYTIVPSEPPQPKVHEPTTAELAAAQAEAAEEERKALLAAQAAKKRTRTIAIAAAAAAAAVVLILVAGGVLFLRSRPARQQNASVLTRKTIRTVRQTTALMIAPITVEGTDPVLIDRAAQIRLGATEILRNMHGIELAEATGPDVLSFASTLRAGAAGPELVPAQAPATPIAVPDAASGIRAVLDWVTKQAHVAVPAVTAPPEALNAYAAAVTATAGNDAAKMEESMKAAITAGPTFLPAQLMAMRYYSTRGDGASALGAAKQVMALDPANTDAARMVARSMLTVGDVPAAFAAYRVILQNNAGDVEALTHIATYAASIGDVARFNALRGRLSHVAASEIAVHDGDPLTAAGRFDEALKLYYADEEKAPTNPALSLKIGRICVLMQSLPIADIELKKLQQSDPVYGYHLLKGYIAAHQKNTADAQAELTAALQASTPGDDYWTSAAEVFVLTGENDKVFDALQKAVARKEPTANYILNDPLFQYLAGDARFQPIHDAAVAGQQEIRNALAQIVI